MTKIHVFNFAVAYADTDAEGIGFAIPVNVVKEFISEYEESIKTSTK